MLRAWALSDPKSVVTVPLLPPPDVRAGAWLNEFSTSVTPPNEFTIVAPPAAPAVVVVIVTTSLPFTDAPDLGGRADISCAESSPQRNAGAASGCQLMA